MCSKAIQERIESAVQRKITAREMFTAYDITCQVRDEGARVLHDEVRCVVHDLYETNQMGIAYERTLTEIGGDRGPAYVYHHYTDDPTTYRNVGNLPGAQSYIVVNLDAPSL